MSKKIIIGDEMIETQLIEKSKRLNISLCELIDRYIRIGLFIDEDLYEPPVYSREELNEMAKKAVEEDKKRGIMPKKHDFSVFINRWSKSDD